eukprot:TRINITY_DN32276_c0_g1_i1.p1 TRINITY_DN32276_c0_g1~~TRINITY_DN32276_c0_g1_i1.p1  ORF type:complete len:198 (-),score=30.98 TRINITY_DN32276_c0_g1_i1:843-1436(-)
MADEDNWASEDVGGDQWGDEAIEDDLEAPEMMPTEMKRVKDPWRKPTDLTVRHINAHIYIKALGKHMKKAGSFELPTWVDLVKTGPAREMPPADPDWLYYRVAAVARFMYMHGGCGMGHLRARYGSRQRRGVQPNAFRKASPGILRFALQTLEKLGWAQKKTTGGRRLTTEGRRAMDNIAKSSWDEQKANGRHMPMM